jgi:acetoin utilization protein AcuB
MSKQGPVIQKYMTYVPHTIDANKTVHAAQEMMSQYNIRHLPVMNDNKIAGIVSDRDIKMALGFVDSSPNLVLVDDICHKKPYQVSPDAKLHDVAKEMADKRYGSALVVQTGKLVGIFTTIDACNALCTVLESRRY